jgi:outer membrane protein TolC
MKSRILLPLTLLLFAGTFRATAQKDTTYLTLTECIHLARANGPLAAMALKSFESKQSTYRSYSATMYPQLNLQGDVPGFYRSITPITLPDGSIVFTPQSQASSSLNLSISQKIPFTGGDLSLSSGLNRIDLLETKSQVYRSNPLIMTLRQPIFQINTTRWDLDAQELRYKIATREMGEAMEECASDVTNKFFELYLASMSASNASLNLAINDTLYKISNGRYNVGKIAENDLLQSELAFLNSQTQLENARLGLNRSQQNLRVALGLGLNTFIVPVPPDDIPKFTIDPQEALSQARQYRSDMVEFELQKLSADRGVAQAKSDNYLRATMTATMGFNQRAQLLPDAYHNLMDQQQFTLSFNMPLFRWGAGSSAVDAALAEQKRVETSLEQQKHDFEQEVLYQASRLNLLQKQVAVAAKSDTIAQRRFDVAKERYLIGKIDIPNLFLAQSEKDNARRANSQTLWDYWSAYFRVRRLTLFDFETGESLVAGK